MQERDEKKFNDLDEIEDADYEVVENGTQESENSEVEEALEEDSQANLNEEYEDLKNQLLRLSADFSNYKKRVDKERKEYIDLGVKKLALDLLPVLDNLERALNSIEEFAKDNEIFKGIIIIDDQIIEVLKKNGIEEIQAKGKKFDHNLHHAVALVEAENMESDMVVEVLQKGFKIKESVIRPSMVTVSK